MEDGTIRELQSVLKIFKARLVILNEIHPFKFQNFEQLSKRYYRNHKGLIFKDHLSISTAKLDMWMIKEKIIYHIEHIVIASFLGNRLLKLHFAN
jgi:hypothetical protein